MNCIQEVIDNLHPPVDQRLCDVVPTKVQVVMDRTQCSPLIDLFLRKLAALDDCIVFDKSQLKVKNPKRLSSAYASRWLISCLKKRGTSVRHFNTLVLYCPDGHHVPSTFLKNLAKDGQVINGQRVHRLRVDNIVLIHQGTSQYRELKPAYITCWLNESADVITKLIPQDELRDITFNKDKN